MVYNIIYIVYIIFMFLKTNVIIKKSSVNYIYTIIRIFKSKIIQS